MSSPWHDRYCGDAVNERSIDQFAADSDINQGLAFSVKQASHARFFKQNRSIFAKGGFLHNWH